MCLGFDLACLLGVLTDLPTIGVAKNLLCVDGIEKDDKFREKVHFLQIASEGIHRVPTTQGKQGKSLEIFNYFTSNRYFKVLFNVHFSNIPSHFI